MLFIIMLHLLRTVADPKNYLQIVENEAQNVVSLDMKGCICHFDKSQIHPFISKRTDFNKSLEEHSPVPLTVTIKTLPSHLWILDPLLSCVACLHLKVPWWTFGTNILFLVSATLALLWIYLSRSDGNLIYISFKSYIIIGQMLHSLKNNTCTSIWSFKDVLCSEKRGVYVLIDSY